jgi:hypothetical protein
MHVLQKQGDVFTTLFIDYEEKTIEEFGLIKMNNNHDALFIELTVLADNISRHIIENRALVAPPLIESRMMHHQSGRCVFH